MANCQAPLRGDSIEGEDMLLTIVGAMIAVVGLVIVLIAIRHCL